MRSEVMDQSARFAERVREETARRTREADQGLEAAETRAAAAESASLALKLQLERAERDRQMLKARRGRCMQAAAGWALQNRATAAPVPGWCSGSQPASSPHLRLSGRAGPGQEAGR